MFNLTIAGNVGKDAQLRRTQSGEPVLGFSVAIDQGKDKNGTKRDSVWVSCSVWGKRAESLERYITKGTKIALSGRPSVDVYEGRGQLKLSVNELTFMGGGQEASSNGADKYISSQSGSSPDVNNDFASAALDDEIPF